MPRPTVDATRSPRGIMSQLYPLRFKPIYRRYLWGGRRLETVLGKSLPDDGSYAESWEIVDHGQDQSVVAAGPLAGATLGELVKQHGRALLGRHAHLTQFPLLFKFLDAHSALSVQVHPNDQQAGQLDPPDAGKTEAWVVLHADPGSQIYAGLKRGFDRAALERELNRGTAELCLHRFTPRQGDCILVPAGTVHALGAGLLVAEIQQASDTTFRLFDWNRLGPDGKPRTLHIQKGLEVIDYQRGPVHPQTAQATSQAGVQRLAECDQFVVQRRVGGAASKAGGDDRCHILAVLQGQLMVEGDPTGRPLSRGETLLLPAESSLQAKATSDTEVLEMYVGGSV